MHQDMCGCSRSHNQTDREGGAPPDLLKILLPSRSLMDVLETVGFLRREVALWGRQASPRALCCARIACQILPFRTDRSILVRFRKICVILF